MELLSLRANLHCYSPEGSVFPFFCRILQSLCNSHPTKLLTFPSSSVVVFLCSFLEKPAHARRARAPAVEQIRHPSMELLDRQT